MTFIEEMKAKYPKQHYTLDDVAKEIKRHISAIYEEIAKNNFLEWPGFDVCVSSGVPQMEWSIDKGIHWLMLPDDCGVTCQEVSDWFNSQQFTYCSDLDNHSFWAWRIKF